MLFILVFLVQKIEDNAKKNILRNLTAESLFNSAELEQIYDLFKVSQPIVLGACLSMQSSHVHVCVCLLVLSHYI